MCTSEVRAYRGWDDFAIFEELDQPCSVGNFEEGPDAKMLWGNQSMLKFWGVTLEELQKIHNYDGNSAAQNKLQRDTFRHVQQEAGSFSYTKSFLGTIVTLKFRPIRILMDGETEAKTLVFCIVEGEKDSFQSSQDKHVGGYSSEMMRNMNIISIMFEPCEDYNDAISARSHFCSPRAKEFYFLQNSGKNINGDALTLRDVLDSCVLGAAMRKKIKQELKSFSADSTQIEFTCRKRATREDGDQTGTWHQVIFSWGRDPFSLKPCMMVCETDVTALMNAEQSLSSLNQAQAALRRFVDMVGHELLTPVHGITGLCQALLSSESLDAASVSLVNTINGRAKHLAGLVKNMLDLASCTDAERTITLETFDLHKTVQKVLEEQGETVRGRLELINHVSRNFLVQGHAGKIEQVLQGLVENAVKFTERGNVSINAELHEKYVLVEVTGSNPNRYRRALQQIDLSS